MFLTKLLLQWHHTFNGSPHFETAAAIAVAVAVAAVVVAVVVTVVVALVFLLPLSIFPSLPLTLTLGDAGAV